MAEAMDISTDETKEARFARIRAERAFKESPAGFLKELETLPGFPKESREDALTVFIFSKRVLASALASDYGAFKVEWAKKYGIENPANSVLWHYASGSSINPAYPTWENFDFTNADFENGQKVLTMLEDFEKTLSTQDKTVFDLLGAQEEAKNTIAAIQAQEAVA